MLVLSRKEGDRILIGDNVEVIVIKSRSGRVKIGINAPKDVPVNRNEVAERAQWKNDDSSSSRTRQLVGA